MLDQSQSHTPQKTLQPDLSPPASLAGLDPMSLMDAVISSAHHEWQPPLASELEEIMVGYENFSYLDRGGMGAVYSARQISLSRRVAIKVLPSELSESADFVRLFEREGHMLGQLQHPHIVTVYESGRTSAGHLYIVMEFVEGVPLSETLLKQKISVKRALEITAQVCEALQYAHGRGVIHLDIKPANILLDERGLVRVADFGIARSTRKRTTSLHLSKGHSSTAGTEGYSAPEQQKPGSIVDHRADIYSLGMTLYEMLTGHLPYGMIDLPSKKVRVSAAVDKLVMRAIHELPHDRFQSAFEMHRAISSAMLRMGTPLVQRAIISRPIVSMMTSLIVGMSLIYLLDGLDKQINAKPINARALAAKAAQQSMAMEDAGAVISGRPRTSDFSIIQLDENWAISRVPLRTEVIDEWLLKNPSWQQAEIHSEQEQKEVAALIRGVNFLRPVGLGGYSDDSIGPNAFAWNSHHPMDYQNWMEVPEGGQLILTEIQARNRQTLKTVSGETPDWVEIFNPTSAPISIVGYHFRHYFGDQNQSVIFGSAWINKRSIPMGVSEFIQPGERRVIAFNSRLIREDGFIKTPLLLNEAKGRLEWMNPQGMIIQRFSEYWLDFPEDASLGISSDLKNWGWCEKATPAAPNAPIKTSFKAPEKSQPIYQKIIMHPEFDCRWMRCPRYVSNHLLLKKARVK